MNKNILEIVLTTHKIFRTFKTLYQRQKQCLICTKAALIHVWEINLLPLAPNLFDWCAKMTNRVHRTNVISLN